MQLKQLIMLLMFFLGSQLTIYAQIWDSTMIQGKCKVFCCNNTNFYPSIIEDVNNPSNIYLSFPILIKEGNDNISTIYKVDNNLNILDSIKTKSKYNSIKYNDKLYGLNLSSYINTEQGAYVDTIYFISWDMSENKIEKRVISTFNNDSIKCRPAGSKAFFTKDRNIVLFRTDNFRKSITYSNILIIDTLGNIINSKTIQHEEPQTPADMVESNNNFELFIAKYSNPKSPTMFSLDIKTLDIIDSISDFDSTLGVSNFKFINDSIFITISGYLTEDDNIDNEKIRIVNRYTKDIKSIDIPIYAYHGLDIAYNYPVFSNKIDYIDADSIYFVTYYSSSFSIWPNNFIIKLQNFNIDGTMNFEYDLNFDTLSIKTIYSVKATSDGGLIIALATFYEGYFIKFMPNGFVSITNIETNEKASLKVYPNPSKDIINVDIEADRFSSSEIELFDIQGRLVKKSKLNAQIGNRIDVSTLNPGAYTYRVVINGKGISGKVIIGE